MVADPGGMRKGFVILSEAKDLKLEARRSVA